MIGTSPRSIPAAWLAPVLMLAAVPGCASPMMRATPFNDRGPTASRERVNLWPLAYVDPPNVSVAWPIFDKTPDHLAVRPFFSVYRLDEPKRHYNVLWPLAQFDFAGEHHHIVPFFWGRAEWCGPYFGALPLFWWSREIKGMGPVVWWDRGSTFFPLWMHSRSDSGYSTHVLWPILHFRNDSVERGWRAWPFYGGYRSPDGTRSHGFTLWPLGLHRRDGADSFRAALPFYVDRRLGDEGWRLVAPLWYRQWDADSSLTVTPLWAAGRRGSGSWSALLPFYYRDADPQADTGRFITPLVGRTWDAERARWLLIPLASSVAWGEGEKEIWGLGPVFRARWGSERSAGHLLPLYAYDRARRQFLSLPFSIRRGDDGFVNLLAVGAHWSWDAQGNRAVYLLPPLVGFVRGPNMRGAQVLPLFSWERQGESSSLWVIPWMNFEKSAGRSSSHFAPFWSYSARRDDQAAESDFRVLGWLYQHERQRRSAAPPPRQPDDAQGGEAPGPEVDHVRARVLWKVFDYERTGRDKSLDCIPFVSTDSRADGYRRFAIMWRLFRTVREADGGRKVDVLFLPVFRRKGTPPTAPPGPDRQENVEDQP